ncbi:MAG: PD40 domain-containing protein [Chloroflexi bacterium]|nr:PD40 domain-containing protein [Chloroflexota bacterium]
MSACANRPQRAAEPRATSQSNEKRRFRFLVLGLVLLASFFTLSASGGGSGSELWVINADGSSLTGLGVKGRSPTWSPDGSAIAFKWPMHTTTPTIGVMNADGTSVRSLPSSTTANPEASVLGGPFWSRDGKRLAFEVVGGLMIVMNSDGSETRQVDRLTEPYMGFGMSPDGKKRIVSVYRNETGYSDIYVKLVDGTGQVLIGNTRTFSAGSTGPGSLHAWFPDNNRLVLASFKSTPREIYLMNADGSGLKNLGKGDQPAVPPDGTKIAFSLDGNIWVMDQYGTNRIQLTSGAAWDDDPAWSPDSKRIVFVRSPPPPACIGGPL